jgi:hypothetical protein
VKEVVKTLLISVEKASVMEKGCKVVAELGSADDLLFLLVLYFLFM